MKRFKYLALGLFLGTVGLWGLAVTLPHTFAPGDELKSAEMNANFQALRDAVNALEAKLAAVEAGMLALPSQQGKLAYVFVTSDGTADADYQFNSAGGAITARKALRGYYEVTIPNLALNPTGDHGGNVQVTAYGGTAVVCKVFRWITPDPGTDTTVEVYCYDTAGARANSAFTLLAVR